MAALSVILQLASFAHSMPTANLVNITILAPEGTTNHSDPRLFCAPTKARDVALFFFESYLAHSATVRTLPGEPFLSSLHTIILALFIPATGTTRGLRAISQGGIFTRDPVRAAIRAGAVCEVVRGRSWQAKDGDVVRNLKITRKESVRPETPLEEIIVDIAIHESFKPFSEEAGVFWPASGWTSTFGRSVHGRCIIPPDYVLAIVPRDAQFERDGGDPEAVPSDVASSFDFSKGILGILQLFWASYTLARTRGDQLERYGYAAFGLTVIPYLLMTFINLVSLVITPSYSHVYLASSQIMEEAKSTRQGKFKGEIGRLRNRPVVDKRKRKLVDVQFEEIGDQLYLTPLREADKPGDDQTYELNRSILEENLGAATGGRYKVKWKSAPSGKSAPWGISVPFRKLVLLGKSLLLGRSAPSEIASERQDPDVLIGTASRPPPEMPDDSNYAALRIIQLSYLIGCCSIAFVGGLSRFQAGESTRAQRVWTMSWLVNGIFLAPLSSDLRIMVQSLSMSGFWPKYLLFTYLGLAVFTYAIPALGGFVVVSQMIWSYGNCEKLF